MFRGLIVFAFFFAGACKFEPIGATAAAKDAAIELDAGTDAGVPVDRDAKAPDATDGDMDAETYPDADVPDADVPDVVVNDAGLPARTSYFPSAGGGEMSSARHRARIITGGSAAPLTATSTTHRVQFGGAR